MSPKSGTLYDNFTVSKFKKGWILGSVRFVQSASGWKQFPAGNPPHLALAGRSNSGKSSFLNTLAGRKVAKVSSNPGKTRLLNLFDFENRLWLVDMPGYGYASCSHQERESWKKMVEDYLTECHSLKGLILLMDIRRSWSLEEKRLVDFCEVSDLKVLIGLTKADKLSFSQWKSKTMELEKQLNLPCFALSSLKKWGARELMGHILKHWV